MNPLLERLAKHKFDTEKYKDYTDVVKLSDIEAELERMKCENCKWIKDCYIIKAIQSLHSSEHDYEAEKNFFCSQFEEK